MSILFIPFGLHFCWMYTFGGELLSHTVGIDLAAVDMAKLFSKVVIKELLCFSSIFVTLLPHQATGRHQLPGLFSLQK